MDISQCRGNTCNKKVESTDHSSAFLIYQSLDFGEVTGGLTEAVTAPVPDAVTAFLLLPMTPGGSSGPEARDALVALAVLRISGENTQMQQPLARM